MHLLARRGYLGSTVGLFLRVCALPAVAAEDAGADHGHDEREHHDHHHHREGEAPVVNGRVLGLILEPPAAEDGGGWRRGREAGRRHAGVARRLRQGLRGLGSRSGAHPFSSQRRRAAPAFMPGSRVAAWRLLGVHIACLLLGCFLRSALLLLPPLPRPPPPLLLQLLLLCVCRRRRPISARAAAGVAVRKPAARCSKLTGW